MRTLFAGLKRERFLAGIGPDAFAAKAASFLATLNAIHPFRDGNGRTQTAFVILLADEAGRPFAMERFEPESFKAAMIASFFGDEAPLAAQISDLIAGV